MSARRRPPVTFRRIGKWGGQVFRPAAGFQSEAFLQPASVGIGEDLSPVRALLTGVSSVS